MAKKNKIKFKKLALYLSLVPLTGLFFVACQRQEVSTPPPIKEQPNPQPLEPGVFPDDPNGPKEPQNDIPPIDQGKKPHVQAPMPAPKPKDPVPEPVKPSPPSQPTKVKSGVNDYKYNVNNQELKKLIQTNEHGFSPKSLVLALKEKQSAKSDIQWLKTFLDANEQSNVEWNDLSNFDLEADDKQGTLKGSFYVGTQKLVFNLTTDDGLLKTKDYYNHIKKLTTSLDVAYESIALAATGENPDNTAKANENANGLILENGSYKIASKYSGTGWIMDRIVNANDGASETLTYIVGTNIHIGSFAAAFLRNIGGVDGVGGADVPLDPLNIQFAWKRNVDGEDDNGFANTKAPTLPQNEVTNLRFGSSNLLANRFDFRTSWLIRGGAYSSIRSYYKPTREMLAQKRKLMDSLIFSPIHQTTATVAGQNITYQSLGADFMAIKMEFKKTDLARRWPELYKAYQEGTEAQLFSKINTIKTSTDKEDLFTGGYPGYRSGGEAWEQKIYSDEKYNPRTDGEGEFWKAATLSKFPYKSLLNPQIHHEEGLDPESFSYITENSSIRNLPKIQDREILQYVERYDQGAFDTMWRKKVPIAGSFAGNELSDEELRRTAAWKISNRELTPSLKPMIRKIHATAKKHILSSSEYIKGGDSGSMVLNAKKEIVGILAAVVPSYIQNGYKNTLFYDFNNTYSKMQGNKHYGNDITEKLKSSNIETIVINPKK